MPTCSITHSRKLLYNFLFRKSSSLWLNFFLCSQFFFRSCLTSFFAVIFLYLLHVFYIFMNPFSYEAQIVRGFDVSAEFSQNKMPSNGAPLAQENLFVVRNIEVQSSDNNIHHSSDELMLLINMCLCIKCIQTHTHTIALSQRWQSDEKGGSSSIEPFDTSPIIIITIISIIIIKSCFTLFAVPFHFRTYFHKDDFYFRLVLRMC